MTSVKTPAQGNGRDPQGGLSQRRTFPLKLAADPCIDLGRLRVEGKHLRGGVNERPDPTHQLREVGAPGAVEQLTEIDRGGEVLVGGDPREPTDEVERRIGFSVALRTSVSKQYTAAQSMCGTSRSGERLRAA